MLMHGSGSINMITTGNYITKKNVLMVVIVLLIVLIGHKRIYIRSNNKTYNFY